MVDRAAIHAVQDISQDMSDIWSNIAGSIPLQLVRNVWLPVDSESSSSTEPAEAPAATLKVMSPLLLEEVTTPWRMMKPKSYFGPHVDQVLGVIELARQSWKNNRDRDRLNLKVINLVSAQNKAGNTALEVRFLLEYAKNYFLSREYEKTLEQCEFVGKRAGGITNESLRNHLLLVKTFLEIASYANLKMHGKSEDTIQQLGELIRRVSTDYNDFFRLSYNIGTHYVGQIAILPQPTQELRKRTAMYFLLSMDYLQAIVAQGGTLTLGKIALCNPAFMAIKVYLDFPEKEFGRKRNLVTEEDLKEAKALLKQIQSVTDVEELRSAWRLWARVQLTVAGYHYRSAQLKSKALLEQHKAVIHTFDQLCKNGRTQAMKILEHIEDHNAPSIECIGENIKKLKKCQLFQNIVADLYKWNVSNNTLEETEAYVQGLSKAFRKDKDSLKAKATEIEEDICKLAENITNGLLPRIQPFVKNCQKLESCICTLPTSAVRVIKLYKLAEKAIGHFQDTHVSLLQTAKESLAIPNLAQVEQEIDDIQLYLTNIRKSDRNQLDFHINESIENHFQSFNCNLQPAEEQLETNIHVLLRFFEHYFKSFANLHHCLGTVVQGHKSICIDVRCEVQTAVQILSNVINDVQAGNVYEELKLAKEFYQYLTTTVNTDCTDELLLTTLWPVAVVTEV